jgi:hypothetical protein
MNLDRQTAGTAPVDEADEAGDFAAEADRPAPGLLREFADFLRHNKKWWLLPILLVLGVLGVLIALGGTAAAPFIYTLF